MKNTIVKKFISPNNYWLFEIHVWKNNSNNYTIQIDKINLNSSTYCGSSDLMYNIPESEIKRAVDLIRYDDVSQLRYEIY